MSSTEVHKVLTAGALRAMSAGSTQVDDQGPQVCWLAHVVHGSIDISVLIDGSSHPLSLFLN